jgi:hypothetical protein
MSGCSNKESNSLKSGDSISTSVAGGIWVASSTKARTDSTSIGSPAAIAIRSALCTASWLSRAAIARISRYLRVATFAL